MFSQKMIALVILSGLIALPSCDRSKDQTATTLPIVPSSAALSRATTQPGIIQSGDWIRIEVGELAASGTTTSFLTRVSLDGTANLPLVDAISVAGKTPVAAEQIISQAYGNAKIINHASISVDRVYLKQPGDPVPAPVQPFDLVRVDIFDLLGPGKRSIVIKRVAGDGTIDLPEVGPTRVTGLTVAAATAAIVENYRVQQVIRSATIMFNILEPAPSNAGSLDLPDVPINPVPTALKSFFAP